MQEENQQDQPGQVINPVVITPGGVQSAPPSSLPEPVAPIPPPQQEPEPAAEEPAPQEVAASFYSQDPDSQNLSQQNIPDPGASHVSWTASEYIANAKNAGWFTLLGLGTIGLCVIIFFVTKSIMSTVVIGISGVLMGVFAARQPHVLNYSLDSQGLHIGQKFYPYAGFKSFSMAVEHTIGYVSLLPLKRFMPPLIVHYSSEDEEKIVQTLADYLPYVEHKTDMVDSLTRRARF